MHVGLNEGSDSSNVSVRWLKTRTHCSYMDATQIYASDKIFTDVSGYGVHDTVWINWLCAVSYRM